MKRNYYLLIFLFVAFLANSLPSKAAQYYMPGDEMEPWCGGPKYYEKWSNGLPKDTAFFPITVWYQTPTSGYFYQKMGVNFFTFWGQPAATTETDLTNLKKYSMSGITGYTDMYLNSVNTSVVKGWFHPQDEPDNAVSGTQDPVPPANIISDYNTLVAKDPSRPVFINLGQGAAIDSWYGRGNRSYSPQDYIEYCKGADVISFDVYPMNLTPWVSGVDATWKKTFMDELSGNIWYVAKGIDNLRKATDYKKPIWAFIECTNYNTDPACKLTTVETKAEVWMALIHGARGLGYFCHILRPNVISSGVLNDAAMKAEVTSINATIKANAPMLNTQTVSNGVAVSTGDPALIVDAMVKRFNGYTYIYTVSMRPGTPTATFKLRDFVGTTSVEVVGESRTITAVDGVFEDTFTKWGVHIYKVPTYGDPLAINEIKADQSKFVIQTTGVAGEFAFESNEFISRLEIYTVSGAKVFSQSIGDTRGSIQLNTQNQHILIGKAILKNGTVSQKIVIK
ncbi:MAG: hypothetical protein PHV20_02095 [Bacteroidales bacterium]|nr:hypothetical protein [Bacteroidales bacterium]